MHRYFLILLFTLNVLRAESITIEHSIQDIQLITENNQTRVNLTRHVDIAAFSDVPGQPQLPAYVYKITLPVGASIDKWHVDQIKTLPFEGQFNVPPRQALWRQDLPPAFTPAEESIYKSGQPFPEQTVQFTGVKSFNGQPIAHFLIRPIQLIPTTGKLLLLKSITLSWSENTISESVQPLAKTDFNAAQQFLQSTSADYATQSIQQTNSTTIGLEALSSGLIDRYIIITSNDFAEALQPLAEWKTQKGVPTVIRSLDWIEQKFPYGVDLAEKMRNFIRWSYENRGTKYVMLAGDVEYVPSRNLTTGGFTFATDYYFADLDGTWNADQDGIFGEAVDNLDGYPEVYVSRIPARSPADIKRFIQKLFQYEKMQGLPEGDVFPANVLYTAADLSNVNDGYDLITQHVDPEINPAFARTMLKQTPDIGGDVNVVLPEFNKNYGIIFSESHGTAYTIRPGASGSNLFGYHMQDLTNSMPGLYYIASCYTNDIRKRAISENYMLSSNGGGVAYLGNSSYEYPFSGIYLQKEFFNLVFSRGYVHLAEAHFLSRLIYLGYLNYEGPSRIIVYSTVVLGDPEMPIWTETPANMNITTLDTVLDGENRLQIRVQDAEDQSVISNALVVLYKKDSIYRMQYTDAYGLAWFNRNELQADSIALTINKYNYIPHQQFLNLPEVDGSRLTVLRTEINDSSGNSNGLWEPGETIDLQFEIFNSGSISFPSPQQTGFVDVISQIDYDFTEAVQDSALISESILPGEKQWIGPFRYRLDSSAPKDTTLLIHSDFIYDVIPAHQLDIPVDIKRPELNLSILSVESVTVDSLKKSSSVYLQLENQGSGAADYIQMFISSEDTSVQIIQTPDLPEMIYPDTLFDLQDPIIISHPAEISSVQLTLHMQDHYGNEWEQKLNFDSPLAPASLSFKPYNESGILLNWTVSPSADVKGYHIFRQAEGKQKFEQITTEPVLNGGYYIDESVSVNGRYAYYLQAIDSSGNQSIQPSDTISAWPALPYQAGFPRQIGVAGIGAKMNGVIAFDLDGDNRCEIIASGARGILDVYNTNGSLLFSVTGMIGDLTTPAIGNVFGDELPEIVVSSQFKATTDNWVFIINGQTGEIIRALHLNYNLPSAVVLKDLDADGYDEIIIQSFAGQAPVDPKNSRLFIWRSTGSDWTSFSNWPENGYEFNDNFSMGTPAVADLEHSGNLSILALTQTKGIYQFQPMDTSQAIWHKSASELADGGDTGLLTGPVSLADIDESGTLDILFASSKNDRLYALNNLGDSLAGWGSGVVIEATDPYGRTSPAVVGNLDEDSDLEVVYVGRGFVYIFEHDGHPKNGWPVPIQNGVSFYASSHGVMSPYSSPILADMNQDGQLEILFFTAFGILHALDSRTGQDVIGFPIDTGNDFVQGQSPAVNDIDRDGDLELILIDGEGYLKIWDAPAKYPLNTELYWSQPFANAAHTGELDTLYLTDLSGIEEEPLNTIVNQYALYQNYPNPFNPTTQIKYQLERQSKVLLSIYNTLGQKVRTVVNQRQAAGVHTISFDASDLASGIYFYRLQAGNFVQVRKMILLR